jgi:hypothetical protein
VRRFEGYWERDERGARLPYLAGIDFIVTPDPVAMDLAIRTGRLDGGARGEGHYLSAERQEVYERALGEDVVLARIGGGTFRLAFNLLRPGPWQDVRVRRAIALWIDGEAAVTAALGGQGYTAREDWPGRRYDSNPFMLWPRSDPERLARDRSDARRLLAEAGYPTGSRWATSAARCTSSAASSCRTSSPGWASTCGCSWWTRPSGTARGWARVRQPTRRQLQRHRPGGHRGGLRPLRPPSRRLRQARRRGRRRALPAASRGRPLPQRVAIWRELERYLVAEQAYLVPIANTIQVVPYRSYVRGLVIPPEDGHTHTDFATVWLDPVGSAGRR